MSDHMLEMEWTATDGFGTPRIVPRHDLSIVPMAPALHYGVQCFEGLKAYRGQDGTIRVFRPGAPSLPADLQNPGYCRTILCVPRAPRPRARALAARP
jgi:hypothetical protein